MIAVIDYGVGNLFSLAASLKYIGADSAVTSSPNKIEDSSAIILPGVGAFADAYKKLEHSGLIPLLKRQAAAGKPILGICLGMQLLFERSFEYGEHEGLGLIPGEVRSIAPLTGALKVPHMGWNALDMRGHSPLSKYVSEGEYVYFVHSYSAQGCGGYVSATCSYGGAELTASAERGNVFGTQYHPEKSGAAGLKILRAFSEMA